jgi:DnaJ-class molecular chaperone
VRVDEPAGVAGGGLGPGAGHGESPAEDEDWGEEWACTHCGGSGECDANANPLWDCDDQPHPCHACYGSGRRKDQWLF